MSRFFPHMTEDERRFFLKALATLAVPLALITLIPSCAGLVAVNRLSKDRSEEAVRISEQVNASRAEITYTTCLEQNRRNARAIQVVDNRVIARKAEIREAIKESDSAEEAAALRAQLDSIDDAYAFTVELLDAVVTPRNCQQVVIDRFGYVPDLTDPEEPR